MIRSLCIPAAASAAIVALAGSIISLSYSASSASGPAVPADYGNLPLAFEPNRGQSDEAVKFLSRGRGYALFLTDQAAVLSLPGTEGKGHALRVELLGAEAASRVSGLERLPGVSNYFIGRDRSKWRTGVPHYAKVRYERVYPGIDLVFYGTGGRRLEYDFVVAPGADPATIALGFAGAERLEIDEAGDLVAHLPRGEVRFLKPEIYQEADGTKQPVAGGYVLEDSRVSFELAAYDPAKPLVIDPVLAYATYLGGTDIEEYVRSVAVDGDGSAYVTGRTRSADFPIVGGFQDTCVDTAGYDGCHDAFVAKLNPEGTELVYSTYLGGASLERGWGIAVDADGNAYVAGEVDSGDIITNDFPTTSGALQEDAISGDDAFFTKLNPDGTELLYSTYLGGGGRDVAWDIAVDPLDPLGRAVIGGQTLSPDFPTTADAFQLMSNADQDAFLAVIDPAGNGSDDLVYGTFLGGDGGDRIFGVAADGAGLAYLTGPTGSTNFPTSMNAFQSSLLGAKDAFVTVIDPSPGADESSLVYSSYLGGTEGGTIGRDVAVVPGCESPCAAYLTGQTGADDFPTTADSFAPYAVATFETFVTILDVAVSPGSALIYSTFFGGSGGWAVAADSDGKAYVSGKVLGSIPTTRDAVQRDNPSGVDAFVAVFDPTATAVNWGLRFATYLGGSKGESARAVAAGGAGAVDDPFAAYLAGTTQSRDFPATAGAFQTEISEAKTKGRGKPNTGTPPSDAFLAKIEGPFDNIEPVDPPNFKPIAEADGYMTSQDTSLSVPEGDGLLANDSDPNEDPLTVSAYGSPENGTVVVDADGSFTYTPNADFFGIDSFTYAASDGASEDSATVTIDVTSMQNHPPVAADDRYFLEVTPDNTSLSVDVPGVLANDSDPDDDALTASLVMDTGPTNGSLTLNDNGSFVYTPNSGFFGTDSFTYTASDDGALEDDATVLIDVFPSRDMHVGDLDGESAPLSGPYWSVEVTVTIHSHATNGGPVGLVKNARVRLDFEDDRGKHLGYTNCFTDGNGQCTGRTSEKRSTSEVTARVSRVIHDALTYRKEDNHDPDGDSDGTSIIVSSPF